MSSITSEAENEGVLRRLKTRLTALRDRRRNTSARDSSPLALMPGYYRHRRRHASGWKIFAFTTLFVFSFIYIAFFSILPLALALPALLPIVVLVLVIIWQLPVTNNPPGKLVEFLFWGFFITLIVWPNYVAISIPGLPWITTLRVFGIPMAFLLLYLGSTSRPFRDEILPILRSSPWIVRLVTAFAIVQVITIPTALSPFDAINRVFSNEVAWTGIFFGAVWLFRREKAIVSVLSAYRWMIVLLCLVALVESYRQRVIWPDILPYFMIVRDEAVERILEGAYRLTGEYRVIASSTTPLSFAELLALSLPFAFALLMRRVTAVTITGFVIFNVLVGYTIFQTASRLGFVGMLIAYLGIIIYLAYFTRTTRPNSPAGWLIIMAAPGASALLFAVTFIGRIRRVVFGGGEHEYSNEGRSDQWALLPEKIVDNPILGFGSGQGAQKLGFVQPNGLLTIDSYPLSIIMDYGLVGVLTYFPMIFAGMGYAFLNLRRFGEPYRTINFALLVFFAEYFVIRMVLSQEANQPLLFLSLAAVCATSYHGLQALGTKSRDVVNKI